MQISDHGAELSSIYDKAADREAVWTGDPAFWNRHAPVLFPFVGKVNGGFYTHKGVKYPMVSTASARDNEFGVHRKHRKQNRTPPGIDRRNPKSLPV